MDITSPNTGQTFTTTNTVTVEWEGYDDGSGINYYEIRYGIVGDWINIGTDTSYTFENLNDGFHHVYVRAYDQTSYGEDDVFFYVDTYPHVDITYPFYGQTIYSTTVTVEWTGYSPSGIAYYEIRRNEGEWEDPNGETSHTYYGLIDGPHTVTVKAVDNSGNTGQDTVIFYINEEPPLIPLSIYSNSTEEMGKEKTHSGSESMTFEWTCESKVGVSYYEIRLNDGRWINVGGRSSLNLHGLDKGVHRFSVRVVNNDGYIGYDTVIFYIGE